MKGWVKVDFLLIAAVTMHFVIYMFLVLVSHPENTVAEGVHQPIGPCNQKSQLATPTNFVVNLQNHFSSSKQFSKMQRRAYSRKNFKQNRVCNSNFFVLKALPSKGAHKLTPCGFRRSTGEHFCARESRKQTFSIFIVFLVNYRLWQQMEGHLNSTQCAVLLLKIARSTLLLFGAFFSQSFLF